MSSRQKQVTVEVAESEPMPEPDCTHVSFGDLTEWQRLKAQIQPGDELWTFCFSEERWKQRMGMQGFVLVRGGEFVDACITDMN